jgi:hypothetical protein
MNTVTDNSQVIADLIKERDELKAHCERLRKCLMKASAMDADRIGFEKCLGKTLASTPQQSLAGRDIEVIELMLKFAEAHDPHYIGMAQLKSGTPYQNGTVSILFIKTYIKHLREQAK